MTKCLLLAALLRDDDVVLLAVQRFTHLQVGGRDGVRSAFSLAVVVTCCRDAHDPVAEDRPVILRAESLRICFERESLQCSLSDGAGTEKLEVRPDGLRLIYSRRKLQQQLRVRDRLLGDEESHEEHRECSRERYGTDGRAVTAELAGDERNADESVARREQVEVDGVIFMVGPHDAVPFLAFPTRFGSGLVRA